MLFQSSYTGIINNLKESPLFQGGFVSYQAAHLPETHKVTFMKTFTPVISFSILLLVASSSFAQTQAEDAEWYTLRPPGTRLVVKMPAEPRHQERVMTPTEDVEITQHQYIVTLGEDKHTAYFFNYHDLDEAPVGRQQIETVLDTAVGGMIARLDGTAETHKEVRLRSFRGREVFFRFNDRGGNKYVFHSRIYLRQARMYQLNVISKEANYSEDDAMTYLESLKLIDKVNEDPADNKSDSN